MATTDRSDPAGGDDIPTVVLEPEQPDSVSGGRDPARSRAWIVAASLVVVTVVAVALLAVTRTGDERATPTTTTPDQQDVVPDLDDAVPAEIDAAAPWDGKESLRLPISVSPDRDLVDGAEVTVSGSGFPPNVELGVLTCTNDAVFSGVNACDLRTALSSANGFPVTTDANGSFTTRYRVRTTITITDPTVPPGLVNGTIPYPDGSGQTAPAVCNARSRTVDCTTGDIDPDIWPSVLPPNPDADPGGFTCIIAAGMISDYDTSGGAAIGFAGSIFRTFEDVTPTTLADGATTTTPPPATPQTTTSLVGRLPTTSTPPSVEPGVTTTVRVPPPTNVPGTAPATTPGS